MADIQLILCKNQQKTSSNRRNTVPCKETRGQGIEWWCQNFNWKFINSRFCACAVKIWLKIALNAVKVPKYEAVNVKSWSPRTTVVKDLRQRSMLTWSCACAERYVVFNTGPYTVLADNSICFNRSAIKVTQRICKSGSEISNMWEKFAPLRIGHVIRRMRSGCKRIVNGILWEMSELITQEGIAIGSSNLVERLSTWPAMYDHWPRSKG